MLIPLVSCKTLSECDHDTIDGAGVGAGSEIILTGEISIATLGGVAIGDYIGHQIDTATS